MKYTKEDFGRDSFFFLGFLRGAIREDNRTEINKINFERFEQFEKYCFDRFSTEKGVKVNKENIDISSNKMR